MKDDDFNQDGTASAGQDPLNNDDNSPQALGHFLLDEHGEWLQEPEDTPSADLRAEERTPRSEATLKSESVQQRVARVMVAENPLLEATQPLLRALSDMPEKIAELAHVEILKNTLKSEINLFSIVCDEVNIMWKKMAIVRYCICTALDEAAHTTPWGLESGWSQSNLLNHFEGDNDGGNKFFLLIGRLSMNPNEFADVLEVLLRILGLGFEGRYSIIEDGERQLAKIRQRLLAIIQSTRNPTQPVLSPHGLQPHGPAKREKLVIPVRLTALCAGMIVAAAFIWCKYRLSTWGDRIGYDIRALQNIKVTTPQLKMRLRLAVLLRHEIEQQLLSVDETQRESKVVLKGDSLFHSGSTEVLPEMEQVIRRVAQEVRRVNGDIVIVGHTDSTPIKHSKLPNNQVLSEKRAEEVARFFVAAGVPESKVKVEGVGDSQPVASNATSQGRAKNRRVEFFVTY